MITIRFSFFHFMKFERLYGHNDGVNCVTFWNTVAASGSDDHSVRLWDLNNNQCITSLDSFFENRIGSICHNPRTSKQLFVACENKILELDVRNLSGVVCTFSTVLSI